MTQFMDINQVPKGFKVNSFSRGFFEVEYRRSGMKALNGFLILWLSIWTIACVFLLRSYLDGGVMDDGAPTSIWFVAIFWGAEILVASILLYSLFCRKVFKVDHESLSMDINVLGLHWRKSMRISEIIELQQVKDGGEGKDSFPSWGLMVVGEVDQDTKTIKLISRQPHSRSVWFGSVLADQLEVPFKQS